ncbi:MAG TPA: branched-chain amino acid ABC transporter permease [Anaerolineales bacterium]|nr:branched-chain amino acid ABC transporter permease [Anaerolineales bacterium]
MPLDNFLTQLLNGLVTSMLLFVLAAGLSLIFGLMDVINLTHGAFYLLGGYIGLAMVRQFDSFWLALLLAPVAVGALGLMIEFFFLRRLYGRGRHLEQVLLTFGVALIIIDLTRATWGAYVEAVPSPALLAGQVTVFNLRFPIYRLSLIAFGLALALLLWLLIGRTRLGAIVRAGVSDAQMVSGLGIDVHAVFAGVFGFGVALAALAGVVGAPVFSLYPGLDSEILILALAVVVVGGLGTLKGAFFGSLLIGLADTFGKAFLPEFSRFLLFAVMAVVLLIRPWGLFGQKGS